MYIITKSTYPNDKVKEVSEMYIKCLTKYPDDASLGTPLVPVALRPSPEGIEALTITDVKKGKLEDALNLARNRLAMFWSITGYRYKIEFYANIEEAMKLMNA